MLLILCAALLCLLSIVGLRQGFVSGGRVALEGFDGLGVLTGFVLSCGAALLFGPINGLSVILALLLHEAGHWLALRIIGRGDATFRLFPALNPEIHDSFDHDGEATFHALMGPGLAVAPMVLTLALTLALQDLAPGAADFLAALTFSLCLLNVLNLLPFRLLDGGRTIEAVARVLSPSVHYLAVASAVAGLGLAGLSTGLPWTYFVAALGILGLLLRPSRPRTHAMSAREAGLAFAAWCALLATHVSGGALIVTATL
ncbi:hypothetical protein [Frigidibacter sp. ROC022]|uniref:hypothetical protein n=1 Tax=Frigidibacter sp. ROC022 TaxID=2971796 RepID=UPI00215A1F41|nr:hypothetical protein [Frigidibacter sp. ROC022]MCR8722805.1 hypothetical protein [Frigidibacter sp. ROC022]